jgi:hypothetical protein
MEFVPVLVILATVKKVVDFVRFARAGDLNSVVTQLVAWFAGFLIIALAAHTPWAAALVFGGVPLAKLGVAAQLLVGIAIGSSGSLATDIIKATDNTQTAAVPSLLYPTPVARPPLDR